MAASDKHARTERPTPKRRKDARDRGQVARSVDVSGWAAIVLGSFVLPWYLAGAKARVVGLVAQAADVARAPTVPGALVVLESGLRAFLLTVAPLGGLFGLLAIAVSIAQTGRTLSLKAAAPKLSRLSPRTGFQRMFSAQNGMQLAKQLVKLVLLGAVTYQALSALTRELATREPVSVLPVLAATGASILGFVRVIAGLGLAVGIADYLFQRHKLQQSLKMTKEEVKEEHKSSEGDPYVKAMVRKRMYSLARSRAMAAVRGADVVVTNPTHYAVALEYDAARAGAPRVVAKGADLLAQRMRDEAATFAVPVVEDPPLARYLFAICEVDEQIPAEIYVAVARLLAFVYSLPAAARGVGVHHLSPSAVPAEPAMMAHVSEHRRKRVAAVLAGTSGP